MKWVWTYKWARGLLCLVLWIVSAAAVDCPTKLWSRVQYMDCYTTETQKSGKKCCMFVRPIYFLRKLICFLLLIWITTLFNSSNDGLAILSHSEPEIHLRFAFLTLLLNSTLHVICKSKEARFFRDIFPQITFPK